MPALANKNNQGAASSNDDSQNRSLFFEPQDVATIKVEGKAFKVYKAMLVKDSAYFERALNGPFHEGQSQTISFDDDITAKDFAFYVDILYRSYFVKDFKLLDEHYDFKPELTRVLRLWMLSDRFLNSQMRVIAAEGLDWQLRECTVAAWESAYRSPSISSATLADRVALHQASFNACQTHNLPFTDQIVQAAAAMPPQLFTELHDTLEPDFRSAVTKGFMRRFENPSLKRPHQNIGKSKPTPLKLKKTRI